MNRLSDNEIEQFEQLSIEYATAYEIKATFIKLYGQQDEDVDLLTDLYLKQMKAYNELKAFKKKLFDKYINIDCVYIDNNCYIDTINKKIIYRTQKGEVIE